ncbi:MAG: Nif3-like dinuclear metal center hexameric protein [Gemmatimonadota bacterium]|nr:Nif3-like dinuclear metal center hexameric protein [Gemmatimonadota bacterium]MDH5196920.1 Nif3-like dinuclear metal center hexameric protein [Gemmatimonadota bacterium]
MTNPMNSEQLAEYLDRFLRVGELPDYPQALNGLQVENSGRLTRILGAVDVSQAAIDAAVARRADFMIVHHGLFWGGLQRVTNRFGRRLRGLIQHDMALYSAHIPLDCHAEVGNNAVLAADLELEGPVPFGRFEGMEIGVMGGLEVPIAELADRLGVRLGVAPQVIAKGPAVTKRIAIVTGGASQCIAEAHERDVDTFITGEGPHHTFFDAEEWGINLIYAGHYATETVGVQALGEHLHDRFGIPFEFFDHPTGL